MVLFAWPERSLWLEPDGGGTLGAEEGKEEQTKQTKLGSGYIFLVGENIDCPKPQ